MIESVSWSCTSEHVCHDTALLYDADGRARWHSMRFEYRHPATDAASTATALGLSGELKLRAGFSYWLTPELLCWSSSATWTGGIVAAVTADGLLVDEASAAKLGAIDACPGPRTLFPTAAATEASWLSLAGNWHRDERRRLVEMGMECANTSFSRDMQLYQLDCDVFGSCRTKASLPFRRVSTRTLALKASASAVSIKVAPCRLLEAAQDAETIGGAVLQLLLVVLAASVVYARSHSKNSGAAYLFTHCITHCKPEEESSWAEALTVGVVAVAARVAVISWRFEELVADHRSRAVVFQLTASAFSLFHSLAAQSLSDKNVSPDTAFGGTTSLVDATSAIVVAFAAAPLDAAGDRFDSTARLLACILLVNVSLVRVAFSAACCAWRAADCVNEMSYFRWLIFALVGWLVQAASIGVLVADLFAAPAVRSLARATPGDQAVGEACLLLALLSMAMPRLNRTARRVLTEKQE